MQLREFQKRGFNFDLAAGFENVKLHPPLVLAVPCAIAIWSFQCTTFGFTNSPKALAAGSNSDSNSSRLASRSSATTLTPVTLLPGLARLATRPSPTGSAAIEKTIGIAEVAALAARIGAVPPPVKITSTLRLTRSAARAGNRS